MNKLIRTSCVSGLANERNRLEDVIKAYNAQIRISQNFRDKAQRELIHIKAALEHLSETGDGG